MKSYKCKVGFEGYDWRNIFVVQSPTGNRVYLECNGKWDRMSPELHDLIAQYHYPKPGENKSWSSSPKHEQEISHSIMEEILKLSKEED